MPIISLEIPESYDNITRPVIYGITQDLMKRLNISDDIKILYPGVSGVNPQYGSGVSNGKNKILTNFIGKIEIEAEELYMEEGVLTTPITRHNELYVFHDPSLSVYMKPVYTRTECRINFKYSAHNRTAVIKWRDNLRRKMSQGMMALVHEIIYHFSMPYVFYPILEEIHKKREAVAGYNEELMTWLTNCYIEGVNLSTNLSGSRGIITIPEKQIGVQGWFDFSSEPAPAEKGREGGEWIVSFDYTFQYDKVTAAVLSYPIVIHNQILDDRFFSTQKIYDFYEQKRTPNQFTKEKEKFAMDNYSAKLAFNGFTIPFYDDWVPTKMNYRTTTIFTLLVGVELDDPKQIVNLLDLGEIKLSQSVINYIFRNKDLVTTYLADVFHISFFKGKMPIDGSTIYIDDDLNIRSTTDLNPRDMHHLRFSIVFDLKLLSSIAKDNLRNDPEVCIQVIDLLDCLQRPVTNLVNLVGMKNIADRNPYLFYDKSNPTRVGINSVSNPTTVKPIPGTPQLPYPNFNITAPVRPKQEPTFNIKDYDTITEAIEKGLVVIAGSGLEEGKESIIASYDVTLFKILVNHFLRGQILSVEEVTDTQYKDLLASGEYTPIYLDSSNYLVVTQDKIIKPTFDSSKPIRVTSPSRGSIKGPLLSDDLVLLANKVVTKPSLDLVANKLNPPVTARKDAGLIMNTLMASGIIAHRS